MTNMLFPTQDVNRMTMVNEILVVGLRFKVHNQILLNTRQKVRLLRRSRTFGRTLWRVSLLDKQARALKSERDAHLDHLIRVIRHFWGGVRKRARRLGHDPTVFLCYGMHPERSPRGYMAAHVWLELGRCLLEGEGKALAQGFPPMSCPSRAELEEAFNAAQNSVERWDRLAFMRIVLREKLSRQRTRLDRGLRETVAFFNYMMRPLSRAIQRNVLRTIGIRFFQKALGRWEACPFGELDLGAIPHLIKPPKPAAVTPKPFKLQVDSRKLQNRFKDLRTLFMLGRDPDYLIRPQSNSGFV